MNEKEWEAFHKSNFEEFWKSIRPYVNFDDEFTEEDWIRDIICDFATGGGYSTIEMIKQWIRNGVELKSDVNHMYENLAILSMAMNLKKEFEK